MELMRALRLLPLAALLAAVGGVRAQVVEANAGGGAVVVSSNSAGGDKYYGQWTIGDLTCYIARDIVNGIPRVVRQCRNGILGRFHEMSSDEEAIIEREIRRIEEQKRIMQEEIAQNNAIMQNAMRSMNTHIQRSITGMNNYMNHMQQMMQQQIQNAFG